MYITNDTALINERFDRTKARNPVLFPNPDEFPISNLTRHNTVCILDDSIDYFSLWTHHEERFFAWKYASSARQPTVEQHEANFTLGLQEMERLYGRKNWFAVFNHLCPWYYEFARLHIGARDTQIIDDIVEAANNFQPGSGLRINPPRQLSVPLLDGSGDVDYGLVYAHSLPVMQGYSEGI